MTPTLVTGSVTTNSAGTGVSDFATTYTVPPNIGNSMLIAMFSCVRDTNTDSATWNGAAMTQLVQHAGGHYFNTFFYLNNPVFATNQTLNGHWNTACDHPTVTIFLLQDAGAIGTTGYGNDSTDHATVTVSTAKDNSLLVDQCTTELTTHSQDGSQVEMSDFLSDNGGYRTSTSYLTTTSAGSYTMGVTLGNSFNWEMEVFEIEYNPASSAFIPQVIIM